MSSGDGQARALGIAVVLSAGLLGAQGKSASLPEILARLRTVRNATDFRATGRLVRVSPAGDRKSYNISIKGHAFVDTNGVDELKILCEVTDPLAARVRLLIESGAGRARVREGHAGDPAAKELSPEHWGDAVLGSDFTYEDLMESQFLWKKQSLVEEAACGARQCYVIRSEPSAEDDSHYSQVTTWLDRDIYYPVRVEKIVKAGKMVKEFVYYDLRESRGVWSASQVEAKIEGKEESTLLIVSRGSAKASLTAASFDPAVLIRP